MQNLSVRAKLLSTTIFDRPIVGHGDPVSSFFVYMGMSEAVALVATQLVISFAMSALSMLLAPKPEATGGIATDYTLDGEQTSQKIILGTYATNGCHIAPRYSHSSSSGTPLGCLNYVIALSDKPVTEILPEVIIDGVKYNVNGEVSDKGYGQSVDGEIGDKARMLFHDGTQTTADAFLLSKYADHAVYPWDANAILKGVAYSVPSFFFDPDKYTGLPDIRHVVRGIALYDPRKDSTVGGSGTQRWGVPSTWAFSDNPVVMVYNLLRGITMPDGSVYGVGAKADDFINAKWFAAMNVCDEPGTQQGTGTWHNDLKRYRAGYEVSLDREPLSVIEEILKSCGGLLAEQGGTYFIAVGPPAVVAAGISDDDIIMSESVDSQSFQPLHACINTINSTYPDPRKLWEPVNAETFSKPEWVTEDQGLELVADIKLDAVPYARQVRRLMREAGKDHRRRRVHTITLPPQYLYLNVFDTISWTSPDRYYDSKPFEIQQIRVASDTLNVTLDIRERDPSDYDLDAVDDAIIPTIVSKNVVKPVVNGVYGFDFAATTLKDSGGNARKPALAIYWDADNAWRTLVYRIKDASGTIIKSDSTSATELGVLTISEGIQPNHTYSCQIKVKARGLVTGWSDWQTATTGNLKVVADDIATSVWNEIEVAGVKKVSTLPATGALDQIVMLSSTGTLYRWTGSAWSTSIYTQPSANSVNIASFAAGIEPVTVVTGSLPTAKSTSTIFYSGDLYRWSGSAYVKSIPTTDLSGTLSAGQFSQSLRPVEVVASLPTTSNFNGRTVFLTTTGKLMRYSNGAFTAAVDGADIVADSISAGKVQAGAIGATEIASDAITARTLMVTDFTNFIPDSELTDLASWNLGGNVTITNGSEAWGYPRLLRLIGASDAYTTADSKVFPVVPGEELHLAYSARRVAGTTGSAGFQIRFSASPDMSNYSVYALGSVQGTGATRNTGSTVVPSGMFFARVVAVKNNNGATEVLIGGMVVRRKLGGSLIVDGSINADHLSANSVTANALSVNSVTAGKIAAAAVGADQVAANSLTSKHIAIGDFTNHASGSDFEDAALVPWEMPSSNNRNSSQKKTGSWSLQLTSVDTASANLLTPIDCGGGDEFYVSTQMLRGSAWNGTDGNAKIRFFNYSTGSLIAGLPYGAPQMPSASTWYKKEMSFVVPAGCTKMGVQLVKDATAGALHLDDIEIRRRNGGNLIVDGSINADKIAAGTIVAGSAIIANSAIGTAMIGNLQVSSLKIGDNAVTSPYFVEGANSFTFSEGIKSLLSIVIQKTADPVTVNFLGAFEGLYGIDYQGIELYLYRSSTAVGNSVLLHLAAAGRGTSCGYQFYDASTVTGTYTYSIRGRKRLNDGGGVNMTTGGMFCNQYRK